MIMTKFTKTFLIAVLAVIAALFTAFPAKAGVIAVAKNKAGGGIYLTNQKAACKAGMMMFARVPGGASQFGCWTFQEDIVYVIYNDGTVYTYNSYDFQVKPQEETESEAAPAGSGLKYKPGV